MDTLKICYEIPKKCITINILNKSETEKFLSKEDCKFKADWSQKYNTKIYELVNGDILVIEATWLVYSLIVSSIDDFSLIRLKTDIFKFSDKELPFYILLFRDINEINSVINMYNGKEIKEYSGQYLKLFKLDDGKYFYYNLIKLDDFEQYEGWLYFNFDEVIKTRLLERIKDKLPRK